MICCEVCVNGNFLNFTMGPKHTRGQRHTPYDPELLENWTIERLREELNNRNIRPPPNARRMDLVRLLRDSRIIDDVSIGHDSMGDFHGTSINVTPIIQSLYALLY